MKEAGAWDRRNFLAILGATAVAAFPGKVLARARQAAGAASASGGVYDELGVKTLINAWGTITDIGGSLISPEAVAAMESASKNFVSIEELLEVTGNRITQMLKDLPPDHTATITSGAAGAIMSGVSGVLTGVDRKRISQLPDLMGMKSEVIFQRDHYESYDYNPQIRASGTKIILVETPDDVHRAINEKTALFYFANYANPLGRIKVDEWVKLGKQYNIPCFNDCAADTPPISNLTSFNKMGYDLVAFSGGKALRGPQCAGLLLGRKDLVQAARFNASPFEPTLGRGMKVGKEEIVGMWKALDVYLSQDQDKLMQEWSAKLDYVAKQLKKFDGVSTAYYVPPIANHVPAMQIAWDPRRFALTSKTALHFLRSGNPAILMWGGGPGASETMEDDDYVTMSSFMLQPGEERIVASRLKEMFQAHRV